MHQRQTKHFIRFFLAPPMNFQVTMSSCVPWPPYPRLPACNCKISFCHESWVKINVVNLRFYRTRLLRLAVRGTDCLGATVGSFARTRSMRNWQAQLPPPSVEGYPRNTGSAQNFSRHLSPQLSVIFSRNHTFISRIVLKRPYSSLSTTLYIQKPLT